MKKLPKIERQVHWEKLNSEQDHYLIQFCHFPSQGPWASHFPFPACFLICQTGLRAHPPVAEKGHVDKGGYREEKHFEIRKLKAR